MLSYLLLYTNLTSCLYKDSDSDDDSSTSNDDSDDSGAVVRIVTYKLSLLNWENDDYVEIFIVLMTTLWHNRQ